MKNELTWEALSALALIVLGVLLIDPFHFWMPSMVQMVMLAAMVIVFAGFLIFVVRERAFDERENQHRMFAGRAAFLVGGIILLSGIVVQSLQHTLDSWLVGALIAMVGAKIVARMWSSHTQ